MTLPIYPHITSYDSIQISRYYKTFEQTFERNRKVSMQYGLRLKRGTCCFIAMNGNHQVKFHGWCQITGQRKPLSWALICHSP